MCGITGFVDLHTLLVMIDCARGKSIMLTLIFIAISLLRVESSSCSNTSFTWVANESKENPYFWKSPSFNWDATNTLAVFSSVTESADRLEMRDYAQGLGIDVVRGVSPGGIDMTDEDERKKWVQDTIDYVKDQGINGVNVDYEGHDPMKTSYFNSLVIDLCNEMHSSIPGSQISVDVPIYPEYEGRNYDYKGFADACDSLFVMAYDGIFWDNVQCAVTNVKCSNACASLEIVEYGIQAYLNLGVPSKALNLGLPW